MSSIWTGPTVRLRAPRPADDIAFARFHENSADQRNEGIIRPPVPVAGELASQAERVDQQQAPDALHLTIETVTDGTVVGGMATQNMDARAGNFSYGLTVGHDHQGRGYGSEAVIILLAYMFGECRYHKCEVGMYAFNAGSIALHRKLGFIEEGRLREHVFTAGRFHDMIMMGMTSDEFAARHAFYKL